MTEKQDIHSCKHKECQQEPHTCPFAVEIDGNEETLCTCCKDCEEQCADGI